MLILICFRSKFTEFFFSVMEVYDVRPKMIEVHAEKKIRKLRAQHHIRFIYSAVQNECRPKINKVDIVGSS